MTHQINNSNTPIKWNLYAQYIKDLSFENPNAPKTFLEKESPKIELNIDLSVNTMPEDGLFELIFNIQLRSTRNKETVFLLSLQYAAVIEIEGNIDDKDITNHVLFVDCATVIFPYVARHIADLTRDGGYLPIILQPINFHAMYLDKMRQASKKPNINSKDARKNKIKPKPKSPIKK